jgi:hypothetical protein
VKVVTLRQETLKAEMAVV